MSTSVSRPPAQPSLSFSRLESPSSDPLVHTSSTNNPNEPVVTNGSVVQSPDKDHNDVFFAEPEEATPPSPSKSTPRIPQGFDELPIEIKSLTERFVESLSARVHPTPLSVDALGDLFQEFYRKAEKPITTHISVLASKMSRENSLNSIKKRRSTDSAEQQMLTTTELHDRKLARKQLEQKRLALEEAVERAACEKVYGKIWHHRSSEDQELDQKLRSRIAALSLVGIGLKELLISGTEDASADVRKKTIEREEDIKQSLGPARNSIQQMSEEKYPLGKLLHLVDAHKSIVETLSNFFPSSSSADEILPTIIYTLLTSPPASINVISDLHFIQRFRASNRVDGEAAYCLVNLEAAISFLETVELPSLRSDEVLAGPEKTISVPTTPRREAAPMQLGFDDPLSDAEPFPNLTTVASDTKLSRPTSSSTRSSRSLSELIQAQATKIDAASDSFRVAVLDSADQAVDAMTSTVENSFRFLFGRIREEQHINSPGPSDVPVPKTLEDARKLVSSPLLDGSESASAAGSPRLDDFASSDPLLDGRKTADVGNNRVLDLVGGRRLRDHSVDSNRSGGSGKRVSFAAQDMIGKDLGLGVSADGLAPLPPSTAQIVSPGPASPLPLVSHGVESMRNLGNTLNPLNQFAKIGLFGRSSSASSAVGPTSAPTLSTEQATAAPLSPGDNKAMATVEIIRKMQKPSRKYLDCKSANDLKIGDLDELLSEYKRMAAAIAKLQSS